MTVDDMIPHDFGTLFSLSLSDAAEVKLFSHENECSPANSTTYGEWLAFFTTLSAQRLLTQRSAQLFGKKWSPVVPSQAVQFQQFETILVRGTP